MNAESLMEYTFILVKVHDSEYGDETIAATPQNGVTVMDRGFSSSERVQELLKKENQYFVLRIKNNSTLSLREDGTYEVWSGKRTVQVRLNRPLAKKIYVIIRNFEF